MQLGAMPSQTMQQTKLNPPHHMTWKTLHSKTQIPRHVWEICFPLHSFLSQWKTTLICYGYLVNWVDLLWSLPLLCVSFRCSATFNPIRKIYDSYFCYMQSIEHYISSLLIIKFIYLILILISLRWLHVNILCCFWVVLKFSFCFCRVSSSSSQVSESNVVLRHT